MSKLNRITITIQTRRRIVVRPSQDSLVAWCIECGSDVLLLTHDCAANLLQTTPREIHGLLESGMLHSAEGRSVEGLICCNSLSAASTDCEINIEGEDR